MESKLFGGTRGWDGRTCGLSGCGDNKLGMLPITILLFQALGTGFTQFAQPVFQRCITKTFLQVTWFNNILYFYCFI
uniref:Uncharacterized protein n=1 Tax=Solanum tuberosum TaxID=4113 RepID=M1B6H7_SOLTU